MLSDFLQLIPDEPTTIALVVAMVGTVFGAALWLLGAKMSRPSVTLFTVLIGAAVGMQLPQWFNWNISGGGPAVGAAVVLGVSGFVLHRAWIGIGLGSVAALWAAIAVWMCLHGTQTWTWPDMEPGDSIWSYLKDAWSAVPPDVARLIPYTCGVAMVSGLAATILWPKLATALSWSMLGVSMLVTMGIAAIEFGERPWLGYLPQQTWAQLATLVVMIVIGTAIQWQLQPATPAAATRDAATREAATNSAPRSSSSRKPEFEPTNA